MGMYKRVDLRDEDVFDGFSFMDEDGDEFFVDYSEGSVCVDMGVNDGRDRLIFYWKDIPNMIKVLEETYKHCKGQS